MGTIVKLIKGYSLGAKLTGGCAALGLGALVWNGFNVSNNIRSVDRASFWPDYVKNRIGKLVSFFFQLKL